nr:hypothetical protein [Tanacetum cinerariifolium]
MAKAPETDGENQNPNRLGWVRGRVGGFRCGFRNTRYARGNPKNRWIILTGYLTGNGSVTDKDIINGYRCGCGYGYTKPRPEPDSLPSLLLGCYFGENTYLCEILQVLSLRNITQVSSVEYYIGADNCPHMLEKSMSNSWQNRMLLYIKEKEHGGMMLNSVLHGPLFMVLLNWMVSLDLRLMMNSWMQKSFKTIVMVEPEISFFKVFHQNCTLLLTIMRHMARQCIKPKRPRNSAWFKEKLLLVQAKEVGQELDDEQLAFLADPRVVENQDTQTIITHNAAFQTDDLDAFDSDCDEAPGVKAVLMANLSIYDSNVISECIKPKRPRNSAWFKEKLLLVQAKEVGQELDDEQLAFLADPRVVENQDTQTIITHNAAFQTDDLDAFDSDCDEAPGVKADFTNGLHRKLNEVKMVFNQLEAVIEQCYVDKKCFEIQKKELLIKNDRLLELIISQDIVHNAVNSLDASADYEIRGIVEQARKHNPSDPYLEYACKFRIRVQVLLDYVSKTCPSSQFDRKKMAAVTPTNKTRSSKTSSGTWTQDALNT